MNHLPSACRVLARLRRTNQRRTSVRLARAALLCGAALLLSAALGSLHMPPGTPPSGSAPALLVGDDTKTGGGPG